MLTNIKSQFFIKLSFSHINEKEKLKIIKYNKYLQKTLDINITNYKIFSGRYIIYDLNGKGKEYNSYNDKLVFDGEYLNGERNSKGKDYDFYGNLIFKGEYLKGKRNGKGREYDFDGNLLFEGEYLNDERNGKGKEYDYYGNLGFEGDYINGKRNNRKITKYLIDKIKSFEGTFIMGK